MVLVNIKVESANFDGKHRRGRILLSLYMLFPSDQNVQTDCGVSKILKNKTIFKLC